MRVSVLSQVLVLSGLSAAQISFKSQNLLSGTAGNASDPITYDASSQRFTLTGKDASYIFRIDASSGELIGEHYGAASDFGSLPWTPVVDPDRTGWSTNLTKIQRELPDVGRGDFRQPAYRVKNLDLNHSISYLQYDSYNIMTGKPSLQGLPASFGDDSDVSTLQVFLTDNFSGLKAVLSYSVFPDTNAIARSVVFQNSGNYTLELDVASSFSVDLAPADLEMMWTGGDWASENHIYRSAVQHGTQSVGSLNGFSSHEHNPFFALMDPDASEETGQVWGFILMYSGNWEAIVQQNPYRLTRAMIGINRQGFAWPLAPGANFTTPEAISVYSTQGIGGMSRSFHDLYRQHISRSDWTDKRRPVLTNSWEAAFFDFDADILYELATNASQIGVDLFVCDDGWFGQAPYARDNDSQGLGDWVTQPSKSYLYQAHPDWVQQAHGYFETEARNQLILNLALPEVQDFIIDTLSSFLQNGTIKYIKWDHNRGLHEYTGQATPHEHILGVYKVYDTLSARFPDGLCFITDPAYLTQAVLFEGCASGGGRLDSGLLHYFPQFWTSDDTDAAERIQIQSGTSLVFPASAMGCHVSITPNQQTGRNTSIEFRSHVASMCGSYGFELNYGELDPADRDKLPGLVKLQKSVVDIVRQGDQYTLARVEYSNYPATLFVSKDQSQAVLFAFQMLQHPLNEAPPLRLPGLASGASYMVTDARNSSYQMKFTAQYLQNQGIVADLMGDFNSTIFQLSRQ